METINNITAAASKAIWGEASTNENEIAGTEPLSGETGDVKAGEPYDKGNLDIATSTSDDPTSTSSELTGNTSTLPIRSEHEADKTSVTDLSNPTSANPQSFSTDTAADPNSTLKSTQKQEGADHPTDDPTSSESQKIKETKNEAENAAGIDISGAGSKPLNEKTGNLGGADPVTGTSAGESLQKENVGKGTGENYIQSTGVKADGGDFDASKLGADKDADRLLEERGIQREQPSDTIPSKGDEISTSTPEPKEKKSLKEKIKAKLHRDKD